MHATPNDVMPSVVARITEVTAGRHMCPKPSVVTSPDSDTPAASAARAWFLPGLARRGAVTDIASDFDGGSRLLATILANMVQHPDGGTILYDEKGRPAFHHTGIRRVLYCCGRETVSEASGRLNEYAEAAGHAPSDDWPITFVDLSRVALYHEADRREFKRELLTSRRFDVVILDPISPVPSSQDFVIVRALKRWSARHNLSILMLNPDLEPARLPEGMVDARLTLRQLDGLPGECLLYRQPSMPALSTLHLRDFGDPAGFRVAAAS